jgi:hypothetical protein
MTPMSATQISPTYSSIKAKNYWKKMAFTVTVAVILTIMFTAQIVEVTQANSNSSNLGGRYSPGSYNQKVMSEPIVLNPNGCYLTGFNVPDEAKTAFLQGNYTLLTNGTRCGTTLTIWSQQEFLNYWSGRNAVPCYNKEFMPRQSDNINITLTKGPYFIMISGASIEPKVLEAELTLNFTI